MADYSDTQVLITPDLEIKFITLYGNHRVGSDINPNFGGTSIVFLYLQRIYDNTLNQYVYYKLSNINNQPGPTQTKPNHTGNLLTSSHEIIERIASIA